MQELPCSLGLSITCQNTQLNQLVLCCWHFQLSTCLLTKRLVSLFLAHSRMWQQQHHHFKNPFVNCYNKLHRVTSNSGPREIISHRMRGCRRHRNPRSQNDRRWSLKNLWIIYLQDKRTLHAVCKCHLLLRSPQPSPVEMVNF